ncbi:MAG: o-succinylbenzoate synthase [Candidatus Palauibacterales bacterium]|nr:o-succinylbenzoate synthase [Candidatus Palauibacterales bacterium]
MRRGGEEAADLEELRVECVDLREIRLALRRPFRISSGTRHELRVLLVRLRSSDGTRVWSECVAEERPEYSPETVDTAWIALSEWLAPLIVGRSFDHPAAVDPLLADAVRGHRMARAALEMGAWNLAARRAGRPLADVLGGERREVETGISVGIQEDPDRLVERAREASRQGYRKVKLKIEPGADVEYVSTVREALGDDIALAVDGNAAYTLDDVDRLRRLDDLGLLMIEQPLDREDLVRHARLQRELRTPICLDESITGPARAEDMLELGSGRIVNVKPGRVGGFGPSIRIHDLCMARDVPVWCGGMLETGIGRGYNVALASLPNFRLPGDLSPSARYWERDIVDPEWTMDDEGRVTVPRDRPGIGVEVDEDRVEELTVRRAEIS